MAYYAITIEFPSGAETVAVEAYNEDKAIETIGFAACCFDYEIEEISEEEFDRIDRQSAYVWSYLGGE